MRQKVYRYIAENPNTTHHLCAQALQITELEAMRCIEDLYRNGLLNLTVLPLGNSIDANCSNFYSVCKA